MLRIHRLTTVGGILAVGAIIACSAVWGEPGSGKETKPKAREGGKATTPVVEKAEFAPELEANPFATKPVVVYEAPGGERFFALQVQPKLADAPAKPVDYLVVIDTSASKALGALAMAQQVAREMSKRLGADDRMAIWTANIKPKDVSRGFKSGKGLSDALTELDTEVPLGAVDLKKTIEEGLASYEMKASRRRVLVYLGDGKSVAQPVDGDTRAAIAAAMVKKQVAFFAVPLGHRPDAQNLHGLVTATGGKTVRVGTSGLEDFVGRLKKDVAEPILYPEEFRLTAGVRDFLPAKMPPLRRDAATLVVGKLDKGTAKIGYTLTGKIFDKEVKDAADRQVPAADLDNFFLTSVYGQWKSARERPALLPADRALAYSHKQNQIAVEDLVAKAEMALEHNKLDASKILFEQALTLAPHSPEARGGLTLVEDMRAGRKTRAQLLDEVRKNIAKRTLTRIENGKRRKIDVLGDADEKADPKPDDGKAAIDDFKARRRIAEQQADIQIGEAIRQANRVIRVNPDDAYEILKRALDGVRANADLEQNAKNGLAGRLNRAMESTARLGNVIKRDQAEALAVRAAADARLDVRKAEVAAQDRVRERMRVYHNLMDQARELEAFKQAQSIREDLIRQGQPVPQAVTAGNQIALSRYHLNELNDLRQLRRERFLSVLLEVERSAVPFPDEPPVAYPDSAVVRRLTKGQYENWKDWSRFRVKEYSVATFGSDVPGRLFELRDALNKTVDYPGIDAQETKLGEELERLQKIYKLTFDVNEAAFKKSLGAEVNVLDTPIARPTPIPPMKTTLSTVLKRILGRVGGTSPATYMIRRDVVEITTAEAGALEKTIRVYPVADLVFPISPNQQQSSLSGGTILGLAGGGLQGGLQGGLAVGGALGGGLGAIGGALGGGLGALGGGLGALGGGLGALGGGLGALGGGLQLGGGFQLGGGLQLGGGGFGALGGGFQGGGFQGGGFQGGFGGGGFQGGFGGGGFNQGGQQRGGFQGGQRGGFGQQGAVINARLLVNLIRQVVGDQKDWAIQIDPLTGRPSNPLDDEKTENGEVGRTPSDLGFYPAPIMALVVKAPSTISTRPRPPLFAPAGGAPPDKVSLPGDGRILVNGKPRNVKVANAGDEKPKDPKVIWQDALARGSKDPGLIIATADYLGMHVKFDHAAEFLKANLRQGIVVEPWVYKSLAIALRESGGSAEEIERAEVSAADLEPLDAGGYMLAARALAEDKNYERAVAFCRQAAELSPGLPHAYADAVRYAELGKDAKSVEWAAGRLLRQEWPVRNAELQSLAMDKLDLLAKQLKPAEAARLRESVLGQRRRDLVVRLNYQGQADLDLRVEEPTGTMCSALNKQTVNGGTLLADSLSNLTSETYVAPEAFSGKYSISIERVWGKPLGGKAQIEIIRHQGTPEETAELITVKIDSNVTRPIVIDFEGGRRQETAYVPPAGAHRPIEDVTDRVDGTLEVMNKLRALADPEVRAFQQGNKGSIASSGRPVTRSEPRGLQHHENDRTLMQNKVKSFVANTLEVTSQAVLSADRRSVRVSVQPVFGTPLSKKPAQVISPVFPGGAP